MKSCLHLHSYTPNPAIHARVQNGGLKIQELFTTISKILLSQVLKLLDQCESTLNPALAFVQQNEDTVQNMKKF